MTLRAVDNLFVVLFICGILILQMIPALVPIHKVSLQTYKHVIFKHDNLCILIKSSKPANFWEIHCLIFTSASIEYLVAW